MSFDPHAETQSTRGHRAGGARVFWCAVLAAFWAVGGSPAAAQKATVIYIPIGASPGLSGSVTTIGAIESYEHASRTLTVRAADGVHTATLTDQTAIWLDRSLVQQRNQVGVATDCQRGRRAEIKFVSDGATRTSRAEWIKIDAAPTGSG